MNCRRAIDDVTSEPLRHGLESENSIPSPNRAQSPPRSTPKAAFDHLKTVTEQPLSEYSCTLPEHNMPSNKNKILVVDSEVHILHVVSLKLRDAGYNVITAQNGSDALELAQVEEPDLVITDFQVPRLSGIELCQRLQQMPKLRHTPAIMLTARGVWLDDNVLAAAGVSRCVKKPFSPRELVEIVNGILSLIAA